MRYYLFIILLLCSIATNAQCAYPDARSAAWKPKWLTTMDLPPNGDFYYYDIGYGEGESYENAFDNAIANVSKKRLFATGQRVAFDIAEAAKNESITVKARIEQEYWERCFDPVQRKRLYYLTFLCIVASNPSYDISRVKTDKKYLTP